VKTSSPNQGKFLIAFLALASFAAVLWAVTHYSGVAIHPYLQAAVRWAAIAALCAYSFVRRSLTPWIFVGMLVGAELGHELGKSAANLQFLSSIFLKLVKSIVAPLIFSTLVVGIASHSNLKQVGRMGIKALLYFELVTTLALFIGLGAINLTQAGVGVPQPSAGAASAAVAAQPQKWTDIVLHIFPENIAKSVAEGQILQIVVFSVIFGIALAQIGEEKRRPMLAFCESLSELMF
jgi:proton glutamate symport protein